MSKLSLSLKTPDRLREAREAIENGTRQLTETLDYLAEEIERKNGELEVLRSRPLTRSSMEAAVKSCVDGLEPVGKVDASLLEFGRADAVQSQLRALSAVELLALVNPGGLVDVLMRQLDYRAQDRGGWPTEQEREIEIERESELQIELAEAEAALEAARRSAWRAGLTNIPGHEAPRRDRGPGVYSMEGDR
jgi:hypothetical protein